jgi:hypothetical protein
VELWSWWNPHTARWFPQSQRLPSLGHVGAPEIKAKLAADAASMQQHLELGTSVSRRTTLPTGRIAGSAAAMPVRTPTPDAVVWPLQYAVAENIRRAPACGIATVSVTVGTLASDVESRVWIS